MQNENQKPSPSHGVALAVAQQIAQAAPAILDKVVTQLAAVEIEKRATALAAAVNSAVATKRELYKVKPDIVAYDESGKETSANWSKAKLEEKKKLEEKLAKIDSAIEKALAGDFSKLLELKAE